LAIRFRRMLRSPTARVAIDGLEDILFTVLEIPKPSLQSPIQIFHRYVRLPALRPLGMYPPWTSANLYFRIDVSRVMYLFLEA
jgi:hypothetical protein